MTETAVNENWTLSGLQTWTLQTHDGYVGRASWRRTGAAISVVRADGTDVLRKSWGSREIFPDSWDEVFEWLKSRVARQIAAERSTRAEEPPPGGAS